MTYEPQEWKNGPAGGTPITAERLNHLEQGVKGVADEIDGRLRPVPTAPTYTIGPATDANTGFTRYPAGALSHDGTVMLSGQGTSNLFRSFDDGDTWDASAVHTFPQGIQGVIFLDNGEVLVSTNHPSEPGQLWVSDGWPADNLTATWTQVLATPFPGNYISGLWGMSTWHNYVLVSEYGNKTAASAARHAWLSTDYGRTFTMVFDLFDIHPDRDGLHVHGCAIDPYEPGGPRLWVTHGDEEEEVYYSDDLGQTWLPLGLEVQQVGVFPMPNGVILTSDSAPQGIYRIPRTKNRFARPRAELVHELFPEDGRLTVLGTGHYQAPREGAPLLLPFGSNSFTADQRPALLLATADGETFHELWRDDMAPTSLLKVVGPTAGGKIVGLINDESRHGTSRSKFVMDAPQWVPGTPEQ